MARISGVDIPPNKRIEVSLSYIYGIGPAVSRKILGQTGIDIAKKAKNFAESDRIRDELAEAGVVLEDGAGGTSWRRA